MEQVNIHKAKTHLSKLIEKVLKGEEVVIAKYGKPLVKLEPYRPIIERKPGGWKGKVHIAPDFEDLPAEIKIAQAKSENLAFITKDRRILEYPGVNTIKA